MVAPTVALPADFGGCTLTSVRHDGVTFSRLDTLGDNGWRAYVPAPSQNPAWWCNGSTSDSESLPPDLQNGDTLGVTATTPAGCTSSPKNERGDVAADSVLSRTDAVSIKAGSFSAAVAMNASLPLFRRGGLRRRTRCGPPKAEWPSKLARRR